MLFLVSLILIVLEIFLQPPHTKRRGKRLQKGTKENGFRWWDLSCTEEFYPNRKPTQNWGMIKKIIEKTKKWPDHGFFFLVSCDCVVICCWLLLPVGRQMGSVSRECTILYFNMVSGLSFTHTPIFPSSFFFFFWFSSLWEFGGDDWRESEK